jgi:hypothetical protein
MTALPPGIDPGDELEVTWEQDDFGTKVVVNLGKVTITVENAYEASDIVPWAIAALPNALEQAWALIEADQQDTNTEEAP